ncbi:MAG: hypothetical protein E7384_02750 [Ruminococcaceae bacterium]|nr:hypothetical protein [Oscillospiraceae bacterium]
MRYVEINLKPNNKTLLYAQILLVLVMLWFRDVLYFPSAITYITDINLVLLVFQCCYKKTEYRVFKDVITQYVIVALIVVFMLFGATINTVSPLLVLWGMRNNLRFFIFFFVCIDLLDISDVHKFIKILKCFFLINLVMCTIQYYGFGLKADYLGGFFGITRGCNGYLNVFICILCSIAISEFLCSKIRAGKLIFYLSASLYMAILAELKVFYFELIIMVAFAVILSKPSLKTVLVSLIFSLGFVVGAVALLIYDPDSFGVLFDFDALELYLTGTGYTSSGDLNRFTAIGQIFSSFFEDSPLLTLFGFGLGSCEYSQFSFLQSDFALKYGELNYRWFTHAWVFLEQGAVGLILLVAFFVSLLVYTCRRLTSDNKLYMIMSVAFLPTCILGLLYNTAIQVENCYIIALVCAIPYIANKSRLLRSSYE